MAPSSILTPGSSPDWVTTASHSFLLRKVRTVCALLGGCAGSNTITGVNHLALNTCGFPAFFGGRGYGSLVSGALVPNTLQALAHE